MEYIGVCLTSLPTPPPPASHNGTSADVLPFAPGGVVRVLFSPDGKSLLCSGDVVDSLNCFQVLSPLSSSEKRALQAEEDAKRVISQAALAGLEQNREDERALRFSEIEREKSRKFAREMEKAAEVERSELAAEQQSIVEDGMDLLALNGGAAPTFIGGYGGAAAAAKHRRPSELLPNIGIAGGAAAGAKASPRGPPINGWNEGNDEKASARGEREENEISSGKSTKKKKRLRLRPSAASHHESDSDGEEGADSSKLPSLTPRTPGSKPHKLKVLVSSMHSSPSKFNYGSSSSPLATPKGSGSNTGSGNASGNSSAGSGGGGGALTPRMPLTSPRGAGASGSATPRERLLIHAAKGKKNQPKVDTTDTEENAETITFKTPKSAREKKDKEGEDKQKEKEKDAADDDGASTSRRGKSSHRRRRGSNSPSSSPTSTKPSTPSAASSSLLSPKKNVLLVVPGALSPTAPPGGAEDAGSARRSLRMSTARRGEGNATAATTGNTTQQTAGNGANASSTAAPFSYSDFPSDSLSHRLRVPACPRPLLCRLLPVAPPFLSPPLVPSSFSGGLFALSADHSLLAFVRDSKLVFVDRSKGKSTVVEKAHAAPPCTMSMTEDGKKVIVGTRAGHAYLHTPDSNKWTYFWFKLKDTDNPVPNLDLQFSPNGLAVLASRLTKNAPLGVWNFKSQKVLAILDGEVSSTAPPGAAAAMAAAAAAATVSSSSVVSAASGAISFASASTSAPGHLCSSIKAVWTPDSEHVLSVGWGMEDRTVRMWRTVSRAGMHPKSVLFGRLNTPYTYFRPPSDYFSNALAVSPNGKLAAVAYGLTLYIFNMAQQKCIQYLTLMDLASVAEQEKDELVAREWQDPYSLFSQHLFPSSILSAHNHLPQLITLPDDTLPQPSSGSENATATGGPPTLGRQRSTANGSGGAPSSSSSSSSSSSPSSSSPPVISKRSSLLKGGLDSVQPQVSKRASLARDGIANINFNMLLNGKRGSAGVVATNKVENSNSATNEGTGGKKAGRSSLGADHAASANRSSFAVPATESSLHAPPHLTPLTTFITTLCFSPASTALAIGSSLGASLLLELSSRVVRGEEDREVCEVFLYPSRKAAQKNKWRASQAELAKFAQQEAERQAEASRAEKEREEMRRVHQEKRLEREQRRLAREEARRLKLYVGSLPDFSYQPAGGAKQLDILPFNREAHVAALMEAVEEKGDFLMRLEEDMDERRRKQEEREQARLDEEARLNAQKPVAPAQVKARHESFMDRLNRDLSNRKNFRNVADAGVYYKPNSIVPQYTPANATQLLSPSNKLPNINTPR